MVYLKILMRRYLEEGRKATKTINQDMLYVLPTENQIEYFLISS
jgi:hypothetical protein